MQIPNADCRHRGALARHRRTGGAGIPERLKIRNESLADLSVRSEAIAQGISGHHLASAKLTAVLETDRFARDTERTRY